jgi:YbbR domain-containing protein
MRKKPKLSNAFLALLSLLLSIGLFLAVQVEDDPKGSSFQTQVEILHQPPGMVIAEPKGPITVNLMAQGRTEDVNRIQLSDLKPFIDLANAEPGVNRCQVRLDRPQDKRRGITWTMPAPVRVTLERLAEADRHVDVQLEEFRSNTMKYDGAICDPDTVHISGPESLVRKAARARVKLYLGDGTDPKQREVTVEVVDDEGNVLNLNPAPPKVIVSPVITARPHTQRIVVNYTLDGSQPALGFRIGRVSVYPPQIEVMGATEAVERLKTSGIPTLPIRVDGWRETRTVTVDLDRRYLRGIHLVKSPRFRVKVEIVASPAPQPTPMVTTP